MPLLFSPAHFESISIFTFTIFFHSNVFSALWSTKNQLRIVFVGNQTYWTESKNKQVVVDSTDLDHPSLV